MEDREVIFVSNALANGGAARVMSLLANGFAARRRRVGLLSFQPYDGEYLLEDAVVKDYGPRGRGPAAKIRRLFWIREVAKRNPGAAIIAFEYFVNMQVLIACIGLPNRVIVSERNDPARVGSDFPTGVVRNILYRTADMLVCQTDEAAAYFSEKTKKTVILNPIKPDLPLPIKTERRKTVVTFCRLEPQKNLGMLIQAFSEFYQDHPDYTLEIYGDGRERSTLVSLADSLSLAGVVQISPARADIHDVVKDCALFVLPSHYEGLSNSMMEAMAMGLPTICTDCPCGGARMVIDDEENGFLIPVDDRSALVRIMSRVVEDQELADRVGHTASKLRERLSLTAISAEWEKLALSSR